MSRKTYIRAPDACTKVKMGMLALLAALPTVSSGEIIWSGDFSTGDFTQWHSRDDANKVIFPAIPRYGRPIQYGSQPTGDVGDGSLLSLVAKTARTVNGVFYSEGPTRGGEYAAKVVVKNSINGIESASDPSDCDGNSIKLCSRRRTELNVQGTLPDIYDAMPYMSERWLSVSHYIPSNWDDAGSGFAPVLFQIKPIVEHGLSPNFAISLESGGWTIKMRWDDAVNPAKEDVPWQQVLFYAGDYKGDGPYPRPDFWPDGLADFPDVAASHAALRSVNKGGWTDWVIHTKFDARGASEGGTGFLTVWKREDSGPWTKLLHILPKRTDRGDGYVFDHGIGYNSPPTGSSNGGFGIKVGMYMGRDQVWGLPNNRVVYIANVKVGDENTVFAEMSPDGSSPDGSFVEDPASESPPRPMPPIIAED